MLFCDAVASKGWAGSLMYNTVVSLDYEKSYRIFVQSMLASKPREEALSEAIGGRFDEFGLLMAKILVEAGLRPEHNLIDVGCGSGRLTKAIAPYLEGGYLGIDVVAELLDHSRKHGKPGWRFERVSEITIPAKDESADVVCFFSVLTHLLHEDSFRYLREARRVLRPKGRIVFTFLEFRVPATWAVFRDMVAASDSGTKGITNQFFSRDAIEAWSRNLDLDVLRIAGGDENQIQEDGSGIYSLGQSLCVLGKR